MVDTHTHTMPPSPQVMDRFVQFIIHYVARILVLVF